MEYIITYLILSTVIGFLMVWAGQGVKRFYDIFQLFIMMLISPITFIIMTVISIISLSSSFIEAVKEWRGVKWLKLKD